MAAEFKVKGLRELQLMLDTLPAKLQKNVMRSALRKGAVIMQQDAKQRAPVGEPNKRNRERYGGYAGALRDSIRVTTGIKRGGIVTASVKAGGKGKSGADVYYARWIEYGVAAHGIKRGDKGVKTGTDLHPGFPPIPFMRPALDSKAYAATAAIAEHIKSRLTQAGLNTEDIEL